jgi:hypothetical protein
MVRVVTWILLLAMWSGTMAIAQRAGDVEQMRWLIGKTWVAEVSDPSEGISRIATSYSWGATGNFVQFTTKFLGRGGAIKRSYAGMFYYDPAKRHLFMWYIATDGKIHQGPALAGDGAMTMNFVDDGTKYRIELARRDARSYEWQLFAATGNGWKKALELTFLET